MIWLNKVLKKSNLNLMLYHISLNMDFRIFFSIIAQEKATELRANIQPRAALTVLS